MKDKIQTKVERDWRTDRQNLESMMKTSPSWVWQKIANWWILLSCGVTRRRDNWWARLFFTIEINIKTFENLVLILRLVWRHLELQSWYRDGYQDFLNCSLDIKAGIKTFKISVLNYIKIFRIAVLILRLLSRLSGLQSCKWRTIACKKNCMVPTHPKG